MKSGKRICTLFFSLTLLLCACTTQNTQTTTTSPPPLPDARELYRQCCDSLSQATNLTVGYTQEEKRTVEADTFTSGSIGTANYSNYGLETMTAVITETLYYGSYTGTYEQVYCENNAYSQVSGHFFTTEETATDFLARQIPGILMDASLYANLSIAHGENNTYVVSFYGPSALESWLNAGENAVLMQAYGTATIADTGTLVESTYFAQYTLGATSYTRQVTARPSTPKTLDLSGAHAEHYSDCIPLDNLEIPKLLMRVVGDVFTAQTIHCNAQESILTTIESKSWIRNNAYTLQGSGDTLSAVMDYHSTYSDYRGSFSYATQKDVFENGILTSTTDNQEPVTSEITSTQMRQFLEDAVLRGLFAPKYLAGSTSKIENGKWHFSFTGNQAYTSDIMDFCEKMFGISLEKHAELQPTDASGYLVLDMETGLPVSMGISLICSHTIYGVPHELTYSLNHNLAFALPNE